MLKPPTLFISYAWESENLKIWVKKLATKLRENGIDAKLDRWDLIPGDQIPHFMERSVSENDYVLIICTPQYNIKSEKRIGGVGYEGDIMTAEVFQNSNHRKFIPILKLGTKENSIPTWLKGKYYVDFSTEQQEIINFDDLLTTIFNSREKAPELGVPPASLLINKSKPDEQHSEIKIKGILIDEVTQPLNDGTQGSGLYKIPFELNRTPPSEWIEYFIQSWNRPTSFSTMHRPGIASVLGKKIVLDGTTIEEVEKYHKDTLKLAVNTANISLNSFLNFQQEKAERDRKNSEEHKTKVGIITNRINFDD